MATARTITLTHREHETARLAAEGLTFSEIAARTGCSRSSVKSTMRRVCDKAGIATARAAAESLLLRPLEILPARPAGARGRQVTGSSLIARLSAWACENRDDDLTIEDAATKFGVPASTSRARLSEAVRDGAPLECVRVIRYRHRPGQVGSTGANRER